MDFVTWANIKNFQTMLTGDLDPEQRRIVEGLLTKQKAKLTGDVRAAQDGGAEAGGGECKTQRL